MGAQERECQLQLPWCHRHGSAGHDPESRKSYTIAWKVFEHKGKEDFYQKLLAAGGAIAQSDKYVYQQGEEVKIYLEKNKLRSLSATITGKDMRNGKITSEPKAIKTGKDAKGYYAYFKAEELGEQRIDLIYNKVERTHATILVVSSYETLIYKRVNFIIDHQQMNDPQDARYGAYMVYDNENKPSTRMMTKERATTAMKVENVWVWAFLLPMVYETS